MSIKKIISLFVICLLITVFYTTISFSKSEDTVKIFNVSGEVTILASAAKDWVKATDNMDLFSGDTVKTGSNSSAEIAFDEKNMNIVKISPQSHVVIKLFKNEKIELLDGTLFSSIKNLPEGSNFEVRTPMATCGVRGTEFMVSNDKEKTLTTLSVLQNTVILQSIQEVNKNATLTSMQQRTICPWNKTKLEAIGTGFLYGSLPGRLPADHSWGTPVNELDQFAYTEKFGAEALISTSRAAKVDAYRKLTGKIHGVVINSETTLGNYAKENLKVSQTITGVVQGAKEVSAKYYDDGSIKVTLETAGKLVKKRLTPLTGDIFGIDCLSGPQMVDKEEFDEFLL